MISYSVTFKWSYNISESWMMNKDPNFYFWIWSNSESYIHTPTDTIIYDNNFPSGSFSNRLYQWTFNTTIPNTYYYQLYTALEFNGNVYSDLTDIENFTVKSEPTSQICTNLFSWGKIDNPTNNKTVSGLCVTNTNNPSNDSINHNIKYDPLDNRRWNADCYLNASNNNTPTCYTPSHEPSHNDWCTYISPKNINYSVTRGRPIQCNGSRGSSRSDQTDKIEDCIYNCDKSSNCDGFWWTNNTDSKNNCHIYSHDNTRDINPGYISIGPFGPEYGTSTLDSHKLDVVSYIKLNNVPKL
jgi:hypothetical protein